MSKTNRTRVPEGIEAYHLKACRSHNGGRCNCTPSYRAKVTGPNGRVVSPRFPTIAAARNWRTDTLHAVNAGTFVQPTALTVRQAAAEFIDGAKAGHIMSRNGEPVHDP